MRPALSARSLFATLVLAALGVGMAGCRPGSALHGRYNNFRAYYNTYYNATRKLDEGERSLQRSDTPVDRNVLVSVFPVTPSSGGSGGPFQEAIDKSAELLRNRPTSKWADDALLVIGKAYFYQRNFVGAEQKFRETLAASGQTGDRRLGDEARFWLGRTFAAADRYDDGVATLEEGLLAEGGDRRWTSRMRLALGELYARAGRWEEAAVALRAGAPEVGDADLAARAFVLLGQVEEQAGRYAAAAEAYAAALDARPAYELAFAAEVSRALTLGLDAGRPEAGLDVVERMLRDDKHYARRGELALVRARLLASDGRLGEAEALFRDVLYDEDLAAGGVRSQAHYRLGEFYRDERQDFVRASAHFDTAATGYREPPSTDRPARGAMRGVADVAQTYNALAAAAAGVAEADSLLAIGALSDEEFEAWRVRIETERRRVYRDEQRQLQAQRERQAFAGSGGLGAQGQSETERAASQAAAGGQIQGAGFLNYRNPTALQAGYVAFAQRWGDRPLVPNWRREADVRASALETEEGGLGEPASGNPFAFGDGPPPLDLTAIPRTVAARQEIITQLAGLRYELANAFFLSLGRADTAAALYRLILADTPDLPVATRARYALGEIELESGRAEAARPFYEAVIETDPGSPLASSARARLSRNTVEDRPEPEVETTAAYDAARARWRAGAPREAAAALVALADAAPDAPLAPRAYLAAAAAYAEAVLPDTLALAGPMPGDLVSPVLLDAARGLEPVVPETSPTPAPEAAPEDPRTFDEEEEGASNEAPRPRLRLDADGVRPAAPRPVAPDAVPTEPPFEPEPDLPPDPEPTPAEGSLGRPALPAASDSTGLREAVPLDRSPLADEVPPGEELPDDLRPLPPPDSARLGVLPVVDERAAPDSSTAASVRRAVGADAPPASDTTTFTLHDHLRALAALYPDTEAARRAAVMAETLPPRWVPADSATTDVTVPAADSSAADSLRAPVPSDSTDLAPAPEAPPLLPDPDPRLQRPSLDEVESAGLRGEAPIVPEEGGISWRVQTLSIASEGEATLRVLQDAGFRVALARDRESGAFALLMGQFGTRADAEAARLSLPAWAQARAELVSLGAFVLVDAGVEPDGDF